MAFSLINIGFGNMAAANRIMAIISPESAPVKRIVQESRDRGQLILSAVQPETISHRLLTKDIVSAESEELDE